MDIIILLSTANGFDLRHPRPKVLTRTPGIYIHVCAVDTAVSPCNPRLTSYTNGTSSADHVASWPLDPLPGR